VVLDARALKGWRARRWPVRVHRGRGAQLAGAAKPEGGRASAGGSPRRAERGGGSLTRFSKRAGRYTTQSWRLRDHPRFALASPSMGRLALVFASPWRCSWAGIALDGSRRGVTVAPGRLRAGGRGARQRAGPRSFLTRDESRLGPEPLRAVPSAPGDFHWSDERTLVFTPRRALPAGQTYTVTTRGGRAFSGRRPATPPAHLALHRFCRRACVALTPASRFHQQLALIDPQTGAVETLSEGDGGVLDYAVSPSGRAIAYAQETDTGAANLWVIDLITRTRAPITDCVAAICRAPAWSADGQRIAYQRAELDPDRGAGNGPARAWIVDLATLQPSLLFEDEQALGASPIWSPDGARVAAFDATIPGIRVRDFSGGAGVRIESLEGTAGLFSPDGARLLVPVLVRGALGEAFYTQLELVDLAQGERARVSGDVDAPIEDTGAVLAAGWRRADRPAALPGTTVSRRGDRSTRLDLASGDGPSRW